MNGTKTTPVPRTKGRKAAGHTHQPGDGPRQDTGNGHQHGTGHGHRRNAGNGHAHGEAYEAWDFMPAFPHRPGTHGVPLERYAAALGSLETICGGVDDSQPVEQYDGTLGVTVGFVADHQAAVGQLQWNANLGAIYTSPGNVSGVRWCSGTLISCNLFLTAGHCFDKTGGGWMRPKVNGTNNTIEPAEIATNMRVNFNYQVDPNGVLRIEESFAVTELVEYRLNGLDYAIVRLAGNPGGKYGFTRVAPADASVDDMLCIIGHPQGLPKRIEAGPLTDLHGDQLGYDDIDTLGGNSGSGVVGPAGTLVGVHTNGGCNANNTGHNHGVRISSIIAASTVVSGLLATKQKFMDDGCRMIKFKGLDDVKRPIVDYKTKWMDRPFIPPKIKGYDDVKTAGYDLRPRVQDPGVLRGLGPRLAALAQGAGGATPFILSTPHHAGPFAARNAGHGHGEVETMLAELAEALEQRSLELAELQQMLESVLGQYEQPGPGGCGG